jgi:HEAT repeat protein
LEQSCKYEYNSTLIKRILKWLVACLCIAVAAGLVLHFFSREPAYKGKTLSSWVADLKSSEPGTRAQAVAALDAMGPEAVRGLSEALEKKPGILSRLNLALGRYTPAFMKRPMRALFNPAGAVMNRYAAAEALKVLGTNAQDALPALSKTLSDPNVLLSSAAGLALGKIGPPAVPALVQALDNGDYNVRANACAALAEIGPASSPAIPRLVRILQDENGPIVSTASYTLSRIGGESVPALLPLLVNTNFMVRRWAVYALNYVGPQARPAIPAVIKLLQDTNVQVRTIAVSAISAIDWNSRESGEALLAATQDAESDVKTAALAALATRPDVVIRRMPDFIEMLDSPLSQMRANAAYALGQAGEHATNALPDLRKLLNDPDPSVRQKADGAIKTIVASATIRAVNPANAR